MIGTMMQIMMISTTRNMHSCGMLSRSVCVPLLFMLSYVCHTAFSFTNSVNIGLIFDDSRAPLQLFRRAVVHHNTKRNSSYQWYCYERSANIEDSFNSTRALCQNYGSRVIMNGGPVTLTSVDALRSHSNYFHVPYITYSISKRDTGLSPVTQGTDYFMSVRPALVPALIDLIRYFDWRTFGYIFEDDIGQSRLNVLLQQLPTKDYNVVFKRLSGRDEDIRNVLQEFKNSKRHRIICDTSLKGTKQMLREAIRLGAITSSYHYILLNLDIEEIDFYEYQIGGMNVTGFQIVNRTDPVFAKQYEKWNNLTQTKNHIFGDKIMGSDAALSYDIAKVMEQATWSVLDDKYGIGAGEYLQHRNGRDCSDTDFTPWRLDEQILSSVKTVVLPRPPEFVEGMTGRLEFDETGERVNYTLRLLSLYSDGLKSMGTWTHNGDPALKFNYDTNFRYRKDIRNRTIIVTSVADAPYLQLKENYEMYEGNDRYEGYCIDLLKHINTITQFTYNITTVDAYGSFDKSTGKWNGLIGELMEGRADIAVASLTISAEREKVIDFTKPFMSLGISIMVKKPENIKPEVFSFMHPLSPDIWLCIVFAYIGVSVVLFLVSRFSPDEWYTVETMQGSKEQISAGVGGGGGNSNNSLSDERTNDFDFPNSLWFSMGALMQQGCDICPRAISGRIVGGVWWFFTLIIISSYTANLAAFLTVTRMESPINSAEDLVNQKAIRYGVYGKGSTLDFFKNSEIPVYKKMWDFMKNAEPSVFTESSTQGVETVRNSDGKYAFLMESSSNEFTSQQQPCDTMKVGSNLDSKGYGIGVSRNLTEFGDNLTLAILELREKGILQKLKKKWWYDKSQCDDIPEGGRNSLSLSNVAGVFYILVSGLAVAMVIAVLEFYWKSRTLSRKQKVSLKTAMKNKVRLSVTGDATPLPPELTPILKKQSNGFDQTPGASETSQTEKKLTPPGDTEV